MKSADRIVRAAPEPRRAVALRQAPLPVPRPAPASVATAELSRSAPGPDGPPAPGGSAQAGSRRVAPPGQAAPAPPEVVGGPDRGVASGPGRPGSALVNSPPIGPGSPAMPDAVPPEPAADTKRVAALLPPAGAAQDERPADGHAAPGVLSVEIGRVGAEGGSTDIHVVVINSTQGDVRGVDVRCAARDAQGMQVGQAETRIAGIAKADVAFGNVLFPSELTAANSRFSCVALRPAEAGGAGP